QLLQLSGLGPADLLQEFGIPVIRDIAGIGANLHDHFNSKLVWRCAQPVTLNDLAASLTQKIKAVAEYVWCRSGHLSNTAACAGAFVRSDKRLEQPDLQINMFGGAALGRIGSEMKPHPFSAFSLLVVHLCPSARGSVR